MKEKRYFCDFWFGTGESFKHLYTIILLSSFIVLIASSAISYGIISLKYGYELASYSESTYQYLDEIADELICEGQGINLLVIPNDVAEYEIVKEDGGITFEYSLDNNKGMLFASPAHMTVELSENFEIISKQPNCVSEEQYVTDTKYVMAFASFCIGTVSCIIIAISATIGCTIAAFISKANKKKDKKLP